MHKVARFVFWSTLLLFGAVLTLASYTGVYLVYVAIPVIVVSGVIARLTKPKPPKELGTVAKFFSEARAFFAEEASDAKEMLRKETEEIEKWRKEREVGRKAAITQKTGVS